MCTARRETRPVDGSDHRQGGGRPRPRGLRPATRARDAAEGPALRRVLGSADPLRRRLPNEPGGGRAPGRDDPRGGDPVEWLPPGAAPRNYYTSDLPLTPDGASAGTSAAGVARSIEKLSGGALSVIPVAGPWTEEKVASLIETASESAPECVLIANLHTGRLWGASATASTCT